ncbi:hypothetical protein [uncultured Dubosiella sp.]|uniref:hypothetical protein n=1 Tax=uncultured Dubosiella sp. TaxID=1937011 RepID=UPI00272EA500|nr:hypothetical protein [uncultured Dubosiella sp.]
MENIKNTQNLETSALMMTQYERWGIIDTREYAIDEVVRPYIKAMDDSDLIACYNEFATQNGDEMFLENDETLFENMAPMEAVRATFYGDYRYIDECARFNGDGNIDTYSAYQARREIARDGEFLDWMYANAYKDENQEKRVAYALELVKAGY